MTERRLAIILDADGTAYVAAVDHAAGATKRLGNAIDLLDGKSRNAEKAADRVGKKWEDAGKIIGKGIGIAVAALIGLAKSTINVMDAAEDTANRLGTTTEFISEMGYAAKMTSVDAATLEAALGRFAVNAAKAEQGAKLPAAAFKSMGVSVVDAQGKLLPLEQLLPKIADRFKAMPDGPRQAAMAVALFGREGQKLVPLLNQGSEGIAELRAEAQRLGISISSEAAAAAGELNDRLDRTIQSVKGMAITMVSDAMPALQVLAGEMEQGTARAADSSKGFSALALVVKVLGSTYYIMAGIVKSATVDIAAAVNTVATLVTNAGQQVSTYVSGVVSVNKALLSGDFSGAYDASATTIAKMRADAKAAAQDIANSWQSANRMAGESMSDTRRKLDMLWSPAMEQAKADTQGATGAVGDLGDGFLGAGRKANDGAKQVARAMQQLRELTRDLRDVNLSEVGKAENKNASTQDKITQLARETAALAGSAEREQLLADARSAAAAAHERQMRIAKLADDERVREQDIVARTLENLHDEAAAIGQTAKEKEILRLVIEAEAKARQEAEKYGERAVQLSAAEIAQIRQQAAAYIDARNAADGLRQMKDDLADQIAQAQAELKARDGLNASARAELAIRKALLGVSKEAVDARKKEIDAIREQARELDTLEAQKGVQDAVRGIFGNAIDAIQQGRSPWEAFRTEGLRALSQIAKKFTELQKIQGSWEGALKKTGEALKEMMPELAQLAGTAVGGGGQGAAIGSAIGGAIGSYFGPIGSVIGSLIGGWAGGTFDKGPEIRVGRTVSSAEQTRSSRLVNSFQVRTESMTDPTSAAVADAIVEFDHFIYDMLNANERTAVAGALANWTSKQPVLTDLMKDRMSAVLGALPKLIGDFVLDSSTDLQRQMQNLAEVLQLKELEKDGDLLTGTLERAIALIKEFGRAGETAGQTYQRLAGFATQYGALMQGVQQRITMAGLNTYQQQQVQIELQYRQQIKQANELARAMGLSGARAEDLARIEQLRAISMAEVQRQIEAERQRMLTDLSLSDLSPLRDDQKLTTAMTQLREAVASGDLSRAEELAQTALGLGRNLYASGADYNALYQQVTDLLRQVSDLATQGLGETQLDTIADLLTDLPEEIARALFNQLYAQIPATGGNKTTGASIAIGETNGSSAGAATDLPPVTRDQADEMIRRLRAIEQHVASSARANESIAQIEQRRDLAGIGAAR